MAKDAAEVKEKVCGNCAWWQGCEHVVVADCKLEMEGKTRLSSCSSFKEKEA